MLDEATVRAAYELLIGRPLANAGLAARLAGNSKDLKQLRNKILALPAYQRRAGEQGTNAQGQALIVEPPRAIEVDVSPAQMTRLLDHVEAVWRRFGETDPHWSVLTNERFRGDNIAENKDEFYATGKRDIERFTWSAARAGYDITRLGTCLELGAGVGRVTLALAGLFRRVHAADISSAHLAVAAEELAARGVTNVTYHCVASVAALDALPEVDAFFSVISLQHSPPPIMKLVLEKCLAKLLPGGIGHFQLPTLMKGYGFNVDAFFDGKAQHKDMEHHCLPQHVVFDILARANCRILECQADSHSRPNKVSNTFTVLKQAPC